MLSNLLVNVASSDSTSVGEAALYALLGFAVVFFGIIFLIGVIWLVGKVIDKVNGLNKAAKGPKQPAANAPVQNTTPMNASDEITDETVAIITAAIMAYYQQTNPKCEFTVKRIKRI